MPRLDLRLLGPPQIALDGVAAAGFDYAKPLALLIFLAVEQERPHSREALAELLWPDQPANGGRASLRQALARLRQVIADQAADPPALLVTRETVGFNPACDHSLDTASFTRLLATAERHAHREPAACPVCLQQWAEAVALYRGPLADGPVPRGADGYDEWLQTRREWFARRQIATLARLADAHESLGDAPRALAYARQTLELDPWRESAHRQAMRLLAAQGERAAALAQYERCRRILADELGMEPEEETTRLAEELRQSSRGAGGQGDGETRGQGDKGEISGTSDGLPPLPPSPLPPVPPLALPALPAQPTSFVGRAGELRELEALLAEPGRRLLTLLGPGGVGKTRLALRLGELLAPRFADGVAWAPLAGLGDHTALAGAMARALGLATDDTGDLTARLREAVAGRRLLLILDNFEHLVEGAGLLAELLAAGPGLSLLVTSRERLQLRAEWVFDLAGLAYPASEHDPELAGRDAVRLLLERAAQLGQAGVGDPAELAAAGRIARTVEGSPLALELAAAARRSRGFAAVAAAIEADLDALRVTLRDVPERHRSVRAAIAYSWRLLSPAERRALAHLSVFRGGLRAEAALAVAGADDEALSALADKSMLRRVGERVELHELLRRFAAEELGLMGQLRAARAAHLAWCVAFAETAEPLVGGSEQEQWLGRLEAEHANLRAAMAWTIEDGQAEPALRIGAALMRFWWMRGHLREGRGWLERALAMQGGGDAARARALHGLGGLAVQMGDLDAARPLLERSLALERGVGRKAELVRVLNNLAYAYINQAEYEGAEALIAEALVLDRELGDERGVAFDLGTLGQLAHFQGDYARAAARLAESLAGHRRADDTHSVAVTLLNLGAARFQGRLGEEVPPLEEALALFRALGSAYGIAFSLLHLAQAAHGAGDSARARAILAECLPLMHSLGVTGQLAGTLALVARLCLETGEVRRGARLWGAAMTLLDERGATLQPPDMLEFGLALAAARIAADPAIWAAGWEEGRALPVDAAVGEALEALGQR